MSSTQEKLEELFINHKVYFLIPDGQKLKRQIIGLFKRDTKALIDSAKREGAIEEMKMLQQKAEFMEQVGMNFKPAAQSTQGR